MNRVNDPDRSLPADVGIRDQSDPSRWERAFEVRDKPVTEADLHHLLSKAARAGASRVSMLALASRQPALDAAAVVGEAAERGIVLLHIQGWRALLDAISFWTSSDVAAFGRTAVERIDQRLIDLDATPETIASWRELLGSSARRNV